MEVFLNGGEAPIVYTLGSAAVMDAGSFYRASVVAARELGKRALLLVGNDPRNQPTDPLPAGMAAFEHAPHSSAFPHAAAVVHQGGIGTTAQGLRAGVPMLVVRFAFDQPDNAARIGRLGVARTLPRARYSAKRAASELRELLDDPCYALAAAEVRRKLKAGDGPAAACDAIESLMRVRRT